MLDAPVVVRRVMGRVRSDHPQVRSIRQLPAAIKPRVTSGIAFVAAPVLGAGAELFGDLPSLVSRTPRKRVARMQARPQRVEPAAASPSTVALRFVASLRMQAVRRRERLLPAGVVVMLLLAATLSALPVVGPQTAGAAAAQSERSPRIVVEGLMDPGIAYQAAPMPAGTGDPGFVDTSLENVARGHDPANGKSLLKTYTVQPGDTALGIANAFGISVETLYWANKDELKDPQSIWPGQVLVIPPTNGLVITVGPNDTLESLAAKYGSTTQKIVDANNLNDPVLIVGQVLVIPDAKGDPMPTPTPPPTPAPRTGGGGGGYSGGGSVTPGTYSGSMLWPVAGSGGISQYYHYGHPAIDIWAAYGTPVRAVASGTVVYAGWRSYYGGGNVIWLALPGGMYVTYNHLSAWRVSPGQTVAAGQLIGNIGTSGVATGPHLHFEVWKVYPWKLDASVGTVNPCYYLGC